MSESRASQMGSIVWTDLTVKDADRVCDFYAAVTGWKPQPVAMRDYNDYNMTNPVTHHPVAGICHARGVNKDLPAVWLIYIRVANLDISMNQCIALGGKIVAGPKKMSATSRYCVVSDPTGAMAALVESGEAS